MLSLHTRDNNGSADLFIDAQEEVDFTVVTKDGDQYDFVISPNDWDRLKEHIDAQLKQATPD